MVEVDETLSGRVAVSNITSQVWPQSTRTADSTRPIGDTGQLLTDRFRCPETQADFQLQRDLFQESRYFQLGAETLCFGPCSFGRRAESFTNSLYDVLDDIVVAGSTVHLPFDPAQTIDNLRSERYPPAASIIKTLPSSRILRRMYYAVRPALGVPVRRHFQKLFFRGWDKIAFPKWPVDTTVETIFEKLLALSMKSSGITRLPFIWFWPDGAPSCTMLTHDVETTSGLNFCPQLMDLNDSFDIKSSFQLIPEERYSVSQARLNSIWDRGFEVNVHDSNHDGRLMNNRVEFLRRVERINVYGRQFRARGFRSAGMYRQTEWYDALDFSYDMSIPNVAHLEPQQGGCCTVFPFFIGNILELPLTTIQDYSLFNILNDYSIRLWKDQISRISQKSGLMSFIVHPDYILKDPARRIYSDLLRYLCELRSQGKTWIALPAQVASWWRQRSKMSLVNVGGSWRIEGEGSERAKLAYAVINDEHISYEILSEVAGGRFGGDDPARANFF